MADDDAGQPEEPSFSVAGGYLGLAMGIAGDIALWFWMRTGPIVDFPHSRNNYSDEAYLTDVQPHVWYCLALAAMLTLGGVLLVRRGYPSVGGPLLLCAGAALVVILGLVFLLVSARPG